MARLATTDARYQFADLLNRVAYGKERIVLERRGRPLAALVPVEDLRILEALGGGPGAKPAAVADGAPPIAASCVEVPGPRHPVGAQDAVVAGED